MSATDSPSADSASEGLGGVATVITVGALGAVDFRACVDANPTAGPTDPNVFVYLRDAAGAIVDIPSAYAALPPGATMGVQLLVGTTGNQVLP